MTSVVVAPFSSSWREERSPSVATARSAAVADPFMPIYRRGDVVMAWMVAAHLALAALLAPIHDTGRVTAIVGIGAAAVFYICMGFARGRFVTRNVAGLVLQAFCALHIYQMRGLAEMHFFFFTAVTAMIVYQDWRAMWLGVIAIIAQHTLFSVWHNEGVHPGGMTFFEPTRVSLLKISFHFGIALVQVAFAAWCAHVLRSATARAFALTAATDALRERGDQLERTNESLVHQSAVLDQELRRAERDPAGKLAGGVAHDFNNLLTVIQVHADFARSPRASEAARLGEIEQIRRAADRGAELTHALLAYSRLQPGTPGAIDLNAAVTESLEKVQAVVGRDIELTIVPGPDLGKVWAAAGEIGQVLLHLVENARDAMPNGGRLRIETGNVFVGLGYQETAATFIPKGDYVMLAVEDTGVGMTEEVRRRIFDPFFSARPAGRGTGLGLAIVDRIVRQANGYVWVHSEPGVGTTFKVFFPPYRPG